MKRNSSSHHRSGGSIAKSDFGHERTWSVTPLCSDNELRLYVKSFVLRLTGRKEMEAAFGPNLNTFETVYHFNGQQGVTLNGDKAFGVSSRHDEAAPAGREHRRG